jgi:hypothetical protein
MFNHFRKSANLRRHDWLSGGVRKRDHTTLRSLDIWQRHNAGATEVLDSLFFGDVFVVNLEALGMGHHPGVTGEIFPLSSN